MLLWWSSCHQYHQHYYKEKSQLLVLNSVLLLKDVLGAKLDVSVLNELPTENQCSCGSTVMRRSKVLQYISYS